MVFTLQRRPIAATPAIPAYWALQPAEVLQATASRTSGLTDREAESRRGRDPDPLGEHRRRPALRILLAQFTSPIVLVLMGATVIAMTLGDLLDGAIIIAIIAASGILGFWQEYRADAAVAQLLASVQVMTRVRRDGREREVRIGDVVVGDVVELSAGDLVPADCRLLESSNLQVDASALTGESFPADKDADARLDGSTPLAARTTALQFGSHVVSGRGRAVVVAIGRGTEFGRVTKSIGAAPVRTAFQIGIAHFGWLLVRIIGVLTVFIFVVNWAFGRPLFEALLFALSLAVGITPQMLPAIVSLSLSAGARRLAAKRVVVKRLDAIEDLGSITVLCTDKTGTLTGGVAELDSAIDVAGLTSARVLGLAAANAGAQIGFRNPLDDAILRRQPSQVEAFDELPYDFQRKRLSVLVPFDGRPTLVTKGAAASVFDICTSILDRSELEARVEALCAAGNRVLAIASKPMASDSRLDLDDERGMTLEGLLVFADPPKDGAAGSIAALSALGVSVRVITGDSAAAARAVATSVGLDATRVLTGPDLDGLDGIRLGIAIRGVYVFAEVEPMHKERIVAALRADGEVVAFLGDGINDAPALHAADVGISVDTAVDIAKQASSVVLMDKGLDVVADGVRLGRQTFANTLKYIRLTTSANFGNMASMAVASIALPFLPLLPRQILLLNFLSDIPAMAIASDEVDAEQLTQPVQWDIRRIRTFMLVFGLLSTVFDLITFAVLVLGFGAGETLFQSAWFVMSTVTELAVLFSLRTSRPLWRSRPATILLVLSIAVAAITVALPFVPPIAAVLGLQPPPPHLIAALVVVLLGYVTANELLKRMLLQPKRLVRPNLARST
ncbi:MAG: magnesium-translocating P-type ATPase [Pseudolysinimonas sp.]